MIWRQGLPCERSQEPKGEFLLVRLPVGEYQLSVQQMGIELTLAGPVAVELGEVTEVEARMQSGGSGSPALPNASRKYREQMWLTPILPICL